MFPIAPKGTIQKNIYGTGHPRSFPTSEGKAGRQAGWKWEVVRLSWAGLPRGGYVVGGRKQGLGPGEAPSQRPPNRAAPGTPKS